MDSKKRGGFSSNLGFILAAAGSAVGLGNLWRFPYLAAKNGGGLFLLIYVILAVTFGFALMTTEIGIGRKTGVGPLLAYGKMNKKFGFLGWISTAVPLIIFPYYCVIGGWVVKYGFTYLSGGAGDIYSNGAGNFFSGFISGNIQLIVWLLIFMGITAVIVLLGVEKGIEKASKILMPALLIIIVGIAVFSLTLSHTDDKGTTRTALEGVKIYLIPNFDGLTVSKFFGVLLDAVGQLFYSMSLAMGIMITYGSYTSKKDNLVKSVNQIEIFDTAVALLAGLIVIPTVFAFSGTDGLKSSGPSLMFISLPSIFEQMGFIGHIVGALFFILVFFAALTSSISIMEAIVSSIMDKFKITRKVATLLTFSFSVIVGLAVCFGYNIWYFEYKLPNGSIGQILDILDYISNNLMLPIVALLTCGLVWLCSTKAITDEIEIGLEGKKFGRKKLYNIMIKYITPFLLLLILLQSFNFVYLPTCIVLLIFGFFCGYCFNGRKN